MTGVVDLVACDQILSYYLSVVSLTILSMPTFLGLGAVPDLVHSFITWHSAFWSYVSKNI